MICTCPWHKLAFDDATTPDNRCPRCVAEGLVVVICPLADAAAMVALMEELGGRVEHRGTLTPWRTPVAMIVAQVAGVTIAPPPCMGGQYSDSQWRGAKRRHAEMVGIKAKQAEWDARAVPAWTPKGAVI